MAKEAMTGLDAFLTAITGGLADFSITNLQTILVSALGITVGLAIAWFGYRFVTKRVSKAMRSGRI